MLANKERACWVIAASFYDSTGFELTGFSFPLIKLFQERRVKNTKRVMYTEHHEHKDTRRKKHDPAVTLVGDQFLTLEAHIQHCHLW